MIKNYFKNYFFGFIIFLIIFFLPACSVRSYLPKINFNNNIEIKKTNNIKNNNTDISQEYPVFVDETKLTDIPIPVGVKLYNLSPESDRNNLILKFSNNQPIFEISDFYRSEMDYFGWQEIKIFNGHEICLIFEKPSKICSIYIRNINNKSEVTLFIGPIRKSSN